MRRGVPWSLLCLFTFFRSWTYSTLGERQRLLRDLGADRPDPLLGVPLGPDPLLLVITCIASSRPRGGRGWLWPDPVVLPNPYLLLLLVLPKPDVLLLVVSQLAGTGPLLPNPYPPLLVVLPRPDILLLVVSQLVNSDPGLVGW